MWSSEPRLRRCLLALPLAGSLLLGGCVEHSIRELARPRDFGDLRIPAAPPPRDGSIWRGATAGGSFLYFDRKARGVGDVVTVLLSENLFASGTANTKLDKSASVSAGLTSDIGFTNLLQKAAKVFFSLFGVRDGLNTPPGQSVNVVEGDQTNNFNGKGETNRSGRFTGVITCRVVEVFPNDMLHVYGKRQIVVNHDLQMVTVEGLVRREDISIQNTVVSTALADARLTYDGIGVVDEIGRAHV